MAISLASISTARACAAPKICLYGVPGVGKTTLAAQAPDPVFICTEDGLGALQPTPAHFPLATSYQDVLDAVQAIRSGDHAYHTLVLDSLDALEPLMIAHVAGAAGKTVEDWSLGKGDFGYGKGNVRLADEGRAFLNLLEALRIERGMAVILLAHSTVKRFEAPDAEAYDRYQLAINEKVAARITGWVDALLFAHYQVSTTRDKDGKVRGVGKGDRVIETTERPSRLAKNRYSLPDQIAMSWEVLQAGIGAALTPPALPQPEPV